MFLFERGNQAKVRTVHQLIECVQIEGVERSGDWSIWWILVREERRKGTLNLELIRSETRDLPQGSRLQERWKKKTVEQGMFVWRMSRLIRGIVRLGFGAA